MAPSEQSTSLQRAIAALRVACAQLPGGSPASTPGWRLEPLEQLDLTGLDPRTAYVFGCLHGAALYTIDVWDELERASKAGAP